MRNKKILTTVILLLVICLLDGIVVLADAESLDSVEKKQVNVTTVEELGNVLEGKTKADGNTITLQSDVSISDSIYICIQGKVTIDMNGHNLIMKGLTSTDENYGEIIFNESSISTSLKFTGTGAIYSEGTRKYRISCYAGEESIEIAGDIDVYVEIEMINRDRMIVRGGRLHEQITISDYTKVYVKGGAILGGITDVPGEITDGYASSKIYISSGFVKGDVSCSFFVMTGGKLEGDIFADHKVIMKGGEIEGHVTARNFRMSGGTITSYDTETVYIYPYIDDVVYLPIVRIEGGTIYNTRTDGIGIRIEDAMVCLTGGNIISTGNNGKCGIYVDNRKSNSYREKLIGTNREGHSVDRCYDNYVGWKPAKGSKLVVSGFNYGFKKTSATGQRSLTSVNISAPKNSLKHIYRMDVNCNKIKGNFKLTLGK